MKFLLQAMLLTALFSCSHQAKQIVPTVAAFPKGPMDSLYSRVRPVLQRFGINNGQTNVIKAARGTQIMIPAECFVDGDGESVTGTIEIEVAEVFSLADFLTSGLATVSNDKLLLSNGMIYINARQGDTQLKINKAVPLTVLMATITQNSGFQLFTGNGKTWTVDSSMTEADYAIVLPLNLLYPEGNNYFWYCITNSGNKDEKMYRFDSTIMTVTNKKYENTVIATEEFQQRYQTLSMMMFRMSYFTDRNYYMGSEDCADQKFNYNIFKVYFDHPNRSFRESDSVVKKLYVDYLNANEKKLAAFCNEVNEYKRSYYSNWTDTNYYFDFRRVSLRDDYLSVLDAFPKNAKEIKHINNHAVDLQAPTAFEQLKRKGVSLSEINDLLTYQFRRQALIKTLQARKESIADQRKLSNLYQSTVFAVDKLGWINCDRFFDDPAAGKADMYIVNGSKDSLSFIDCSLIIPGLNVRLPAYENEPGRYSFTKKDGRYIKLPIGQQAVIVGISMQHDSLFFASQKISIRDGQNIRLPMRYIPIGALQDSLQRVME